MKRNNRSFAFLLLAMTAFLMSCSLIQNDQPSTGTGKVVVNITDCPFPVQEVTNVYINIDTVELRVEGGTCTAKSGDKIGKHWNFGPHNKFFYDYTNFQCDSGFVLVWGSPTPKKIDLLKLQNGITTVLADAKIPVGSYDILRLHLVDMAVVTKDSTYTLKIPWMYKNGMKFRLDTVLTVSEGEDIAQVLVDIDLSRSIVPLGYWYYHGKMRFMGFMFNPFFRAINHNLSGSISGKVYEGEKTAVRAAMITVLHADTIVTTALTDSLGKYKVIGLRPGTYGLKAEKTGYKTVTFSGIKVFWKMEAKKNIQLVKQ
jgi:hypothetical protein